MTESNEETIAQIFGYTEDEYDALVHKAIDIYYDFVEPADDVSAKELYDKVSEVSTIAKDVFIIMHHLRNLGDGNDDDEEPEIDDNIIGAVEFIADYPSLVPAGSCGGHEYPADCSQAPANEWYVDFVVMDPETHEETDSLKDVKELTCFISELEFGFDEWIRIETRMNVWGDFYYRLRGHNVDPEEYFPWICKECKDEMCAEKLRHRVKVA